ncbi:MULTISPECIES: NAD(P)-dependent oxidoreductase [unclassified Streptomyces]|uniref:NAD(P)-dependent oxidoreductase n=1 Tax=unclassified Streptomyces TaxID=2593676 RepID=UPI003333A1E8
MTLTVGFIGLGVMGSPLAHRILASGLPLTVWNRTPDKTEPLRKAGAAVADSPAGLARTCDVIALCVTGRQAVTAVTLGPDGLHTAPGRGQLVVDHSSIPAETTRTVAGRLRAANGISWLDAPVSGGTPAAARGTLTVMAGGSRRDFDRAQELLRAYARRTTLMGPLGAGQATKLCNQVIVAANAWGVAEAVALAEAAGIPPGRLPEALAGGFADTPLLHHYLPHLLDPHDDTLGTLTDLVKDLDTALAAARRAGTPLPLTAHLAELLRLANRWTRPRISGSFIGLLRGPGHPDPQDDPS